MSKLNKTQSQATVAESNKATQNVAEAAAKTEAKTTVKVDKDAAKTPAAKQEKKAFTGEATVNGVKHTFSPRTPERLKINGEVRPLTDIIKDKNAMEALVVGNCVFVTKVKPPKAAKTTKKK